MIKENFKRQGLRFTLIKRSRDLCIYGVSGNYTDMILHYEVMKIRQVNDKFGCREAIPSDSSFGTTARDRHFQTLAEAEQYFTAWDIQISIGGKKKVKSNISVLLKI